jgi:hypothetical protein
VIKVFPTGHVGVFLVGGMIVKFLILFIAKIRAVTHSQNMTSDRVRGKKRQEHGRILTSAEQRVLTLNIVECSVSFVVSLSFSANPKRLSPAANFT